MIFPAKFTSEAAGISHNMIYSVNCAWIACRYYNITDLSPPQVFDGSILLRFFKHNAFHFTVRQRTQKMILHQIVDI